MLKIRTIRSAVFMFAAGAVMCFMANDAKAQSCGYGGGYGGGYRGRGINVSFGSGYGGYGGYGGHGGGYGLGGRRGLSVSLYRPSYRRAVWHDTSHLDYHPGRVVRHRNHLDYVPGHYDVHRTGHYDH